MSFDPVPWAIGGGQALHSPEVARVAEYAATSGAEGIVNVSDLRVEALPVAGAAVRIQPGAALIRSRSSTVDQETYVARNGQASDVSVAATGSSGGRSDLIVARVEDPYTQASPWQAPADPAVGPYVFPRVIPDVPAGTTRLQDVPGYETQSAVTLARIDLPAQQGHVTGGMITDLREVAIPREKTAVRAMNITGSDIYEVTATSDYPNGGMTWPAAAEDIGIEIDIPVWASSVAIIAMWGGVAMPAGNYAGLFWVQVAHTANGDNFKTQSSSYNSNNRGEFSRETWVLGDTRPIPEGLRGTRQKFYPRANNTLSDGGVYAWADWATSFVLHVVFQEARD